MSNINFESYSDLGNCYRHPLFKYGEKATRDFLAGSFNFRTEEIEVFELIKI